MERRQSSTSDSQDRQRYKDEIALAVEDILGAKKPRDKATIQKEIAATIAKRDKFWADEKAKAEAMVADLKATIDKIGLPSFPFTPFRSVTGFNDLWTAPIDILKKVLTQPGYPNTGEPARAEAEAKVLPVIRAVIAVRTKSMKNPHEAKLKALKAELAKAAAPKKPAPKKPAPKKPAPKKPAPKKPSSSCEALAKKYRSVVGSFMKAVFTAVTKKSQGQNIDKDIAKLRAMKPTMQPIFDEASRKGCLKPGDATSASKLIEDTIKDLLSS